MATQTTYYEFNKPSGTDLVNPLVDTNPNWDIADAALHELNERSVANCTEVVSLGVHALSTLNTDTKFLKWIATANYTAGETFTLNGIAVAAATPSGASLATNAYVTGAVVMACLNADNSAMTVFLSGTNVAYDSERLGGELPSYYASDSDMDNAQTDITNIQNTLGNTSIVGIGDGTVTGAIDSINSALTWKHLGDFTTANITFTDVGAHEYYIESEFASMNLFIPVGQKGRTGYYASASDYGDFYVSATSATSITISQLTHNGTDVTSNGVHIYYR